VPELSNAQDILAHIRPKTNGQQKERYLEETNILSRQILYRAIGLVYY
jgi:hypothetical protein